MTLPSNQPAQLQIDLVETPPSKEVFDGVVSKGRDDSVRLEPVVLSPIDEPKIPPMLGSYLEYKKAYPDALLLFQVGDFYEIFFEDATTASKVLNLTLTTRDKHQPNPVPMCGVPVSVVDGYLSRLVEAGFSVAVVSQDAGDPLAKGASGKVTVRRKLERIVTPGVRIHLRAEGDGGESGTLSVYFETDQEIAVAFTTVQNGALVVHDGFPLAALNGEVAKFGPQEVILPSAVRGKKIDRRTPWVRELEKVVPGVSIKFRSEPQLHEDRNRGRIVADIPGYAALGVAAKKATRLLISYIDETTVTSSVSFHHIVRALNTQSVGIDSSTRASLELVRNIRDGTTHGTLFEAINRTVTIGGARLLRSWLSQPCCLREDIERRLDFVALLLREVELRRELREALRFVADVERIATRIELELASPRELGALRDSLLQLPRIREVLARVPQSGASLPLLRELNATLGSDERWGIRLADFLVENPPLTTHEGGIVREGCDGEIDRLRTLRTEGQSWIVTLEDKERRLTGIGSLKIKYNGVIGFFFEVTKTNAAKVPEYFIRRQSTANGERFTTPELRKYEAEVLSAEGKQFGREQVLFETMRRELRGEVARLRALSQGLSAMDVFLSFAELAEGEQYSRPEIVEDCSLHIDCGRHPVLAALIPGQFVPNSLAMDGAQGRCVLITGPNMGGKSTFLRQTALIVIMAQIGCYVPAKAARIGIVDRIFARIGASDNLQEGESTFMVEMREAAHILAHASDRSLLLIDEIGRGTATADGLAIAQAILEWFIVRSKSRVLFATHFYELTQLEKSYPAVRNCSVGSIDTPDGVVFTHEIRPGAADRSYGVEVAKLAGLPEALLTRARQLLDELVAHGGAAANARDNGDTTYGRCAPFGDVSMAERDATRPGELRRRALLARLEAELETVRIDETTPLEALQTLARLKEIMLDQNRGEG